MTSCLNDIDQKPAAHTNWYVSAMERLVNVVQDLSHARSLESIMAITRKAARELTDADGATFVLRDGDNCYYADENAISPLWKGRRFPMTSCISGWVMMNAEPAVIEDIYQDARIPADAYRPTFVKSLAMVPIRKEQPVGAIGNYWATNRLPSQEELTILQALANVTSVAMENVGLYERLQEKVNALEISNAELGSFAWAAAHDLQTPLRGVHHLAQWAEEDLRDGDVKGALEHLGNIQRRAARMERLLSSIFEYAQVEFQLEPGQEELADGATLKDDILALIDLPSGFHLEFSKNFDEIVGPRTALQRILFNLIGNAIKHHDRQNGRIHVSVEDHETHYSFKVRDDGPGIAPQYHERIFELFRTLRPHDVTEGSGMGLALVKKILAIRGGIIDVRSQLGQGAEFYFHWPKTPIATFQVEDGK